MEIKTTIEEIGATPGIAKKHLKRIIKREMIFILKRWQTKTLPKHFAESARYRYRNVSGGYRKRTQKHTVRKFKKFGHKRPLEFTGQLKREILRTQIRVTGSLLSKKKRVKGTLSGPPYMNLQDKDIELTLVNKEESDEMNSLFVRRVKRALAAIKERKRTRIF